MALLALLVACGGASQPDPAGPPNVLLVYTDDQRFDSLSAAGNTVIDTPNLDRIAQEGALFERAYVVSSRCCPGRATALTGLYPTRHGVWSNHPDVDFPGEHRTVADDFLEAGYRTAWIGKWHLPNPGAVPVRGFTRFVSYEGPGKHFDQVLTIDGVETPTTGFQADRLTDEALRFLDEGSGPFFLAVAYKNPHVPMTPAHRHHGRLDGTAIPPPASASDPDASLPAFYRGLRNNSRHQVESFVETTRRYWELCLSIDDNVGRLLDHLERAGSLDETVVVLTTDNGQLLGEHGLTQKGLSYEPSIRVPLTIRYPARIPARTRSAGLALNVDLYPTLCDLAGLSAPAGVDGTSLAPLWSEEDEPWRQDFLYMAPSFGEGAVSERSVVEAGWKYVRIRAEGQEEEVLFDLAADPDERVDLARDPGHAEILARLRARMTLEQERLGDA
jgi:N-acetylglucosamine-6-sulfatase